MLKNKLKAPIQPLQPLFNDPWSAANQGSEQVKDNWMMSYIDVLTLLLTLLVLLLTTQKIKSEPIVAVTPPVQKNISVVQINAKESIHQKSLNNDPQQKDRADETILVIEEFEKDWITNQLAAILEDLYQHEVQKFPLSSQSEIALINGAIEIVGLALLNSPNQQLVNQIALNEPSKSDFVTALEKVTNNDSIDVIQELGSVRIEFNDDLLFSSGEAKLKTEGSTILNKWVTLLREQSGVIFVEGHTDNQLIATPRYPSNWELSASRAASVTRYFIEHGIESDRLRAVGYADTHPRDSENTSEARKRNRRVSIVIQT